MWDWLQYSECTDLSSNITFYFDLLKFKQKAKTLDILISLKTLKEDSFSWWNLQTNVCVCMPNIRLHHNG